jgi:hypothetical protein
MVTGRLSPNSWRGGSSGVAAIRGSRRLVDRNANNPRLNDGSRPAIVTVDVAAQYQHVPWRGTLGFQHRQGWQGYGDPTEDEIETSASNNFSAIFRARGWASSTMTWRLTQKKILCGAVRCCFGKATGRRARRQQYPDRKFCCFPWAGRWLQTKSLRSPSSPGGTANRKARARGVPGSTL